MAERLRVWPIVGYFSKIEQSARDEKGIELRWWESALEDKILLRAELGRTGARQDVGGPIP